MIFDKIAAFISYNCFILSASHMGMECLYSACMGILTFTSIFLMTF